MNIPSFPPMKLSTVLVGLLGIATIPIWGSVLILWAFLMGLGYALQDFGNLFLVIINSMRSTKPQDERSKPESKKT